MSSHWKLIFWIFPDHFVNLLGKEWKEKLPPSPPFKKSHAVMSFITDRKSGVERRGGRHLAKLRKKTTISTQSFTRVRADVCLPLGCTWRRCRDALVHPFTCPSREPVVLIYTVHRKVVSSKLSTHCTDVCSFSITTINQHHHPRAPTQALVRTDHDWPINTRLSAPWHLHPHPTPPSTPTHCQPLMSIHLANSTNIHVIRCARRRTMIRNEFKVFKVNMDLGCIQWGPWESRC